MAIKNYYEILNVPFQSDEKQIESAYLLKARELNPAGLPGKAQDIAKERLKDIEEAFEILSDPAKRQQHNDDLVAEMKAEQQAQAAAAAAAAQAQQQAAANPVSPPPSAKKSGLFIPVKIFAAAALAGLSVYACNKISSETPTSPDAPHKPEDLQSQTYPRLYRPNTMGLYFRDTPTGDVTATLGPKTCLQIIKPTIDDEMAHVLINGVKRSYEGYVARSNLSPLEDLSKTPETCKAEIGDPPSTTPAMIAYTVTQDTVLEDIQSAHIKEATVKRDSCVIRRTSIPSVGEQYRVTVSGDTVIDALAPIANLHAIGAFDGSFACQAKMDVVNKPAGPGLKP